ncbi:hypothetical protein CKM354_000195000 [Cercospora kikuchii]|uniref:NACHT domain-containing protein n=1 Tax=Cercospora kikuchii TaxID=84275 RepID=A0A9P3FD73_9PEZI|nr:uncharacterized protein CKM354_000195000 [Cercospora kikuchii]GIZ38534.1 hypothetical protein CKM354_000195000 [Cercospora kikuchii]
MGPFEALSAAAAIAQFIEYGLRITATAVDIYKSSSGTTTQLQHVTDMTTRFRELNVTIEADCRKYSRTQDPGEKVLGAIAAETRTAANQLLVFLDGLRLKGPKTTANSFMNALKIDRKHSKLEAHQAKLRALREQLHDHILKMINDRQISLAKTLDQVDRSIRSSEIALISEFAQCRKDLAAALQARDNDPVISLLLNTEREGRLVMKRKSILASLRFEEMDSRRCRIQDPNTSTYDWILDERKQSYPIVRYTTWLQNDSGFYWVTGKAGSGKSTLMKYISAHRSTIEALKKWAGTRRLITASHYFWYLGTSMQRSYEGLLQSLLYEVLRQCPDVIEQVCPSRWNDFVQVKWLLSELLDCIQRLAVIKPVGDVREPCFCFFIDGLDEYEGDDDEVIKLLQKISASENVKICASSRPWEVFEQSFREVKAQGNSLELHLHTKDDIRKVVEQELGPALAQRHDRRVLSTLVAEIIEKAQGVFLWVVLVIRKELLKGLRYADSIELLLERLRAIPPGLMEYFEHMFAKIDKTYQQDTARIFLSCQKAMEPLPIAVLDVLTSDDPERLAVTARHDTNPGCDGVEWIARVRAQVNGRCQDLLAVEAIEAVDYQQTSSAGIAVPDNYRIEFLHRSVKDFLDEPAILALLTQRAGTEFDHSLTLFAAYWLCINTTRRFGECENHLSNLRLQRVIDWSTAALIHVASIRGPVEPRRLMDFDSAMSAVLPGSASGHWTNVAVGAGSMSQGEIITVERGQRDFLSHLIELNNVSGVEALLSEDPARLKSKRGRPYLDYALRYSRNAEFRRRIGDIQNQELKNSAMVEMLLSYGCKPNEKVWITGDRTVWDLFLAYLYDSRDSPHIDGREVAWQLILHGAVDVPRCEVSGTRQEVTAKYQDVHIHSKAMTMEEILVAKFGREEATAMCKQVAANNHGRTWTAMLRFW